MKVTEFQIIQKYVTHLQSLAANVNMPYVYITVQVGTAINAYNKCYYKCYYYITVSYASVLY